MAVLFRDFSFAAAASQPHSFLQDRDRAAPHLSPTSLPEDALRPHSPPPCSMGELASRFDQQHLRVEVDPSYAFLAATGPLPPPSQEEDYPPSPSHAQSPATYSRIATSVLRMQRQSNTRLHCSSSHVKSISKLVEKMIEEEEQCTIHEPKSPTHSNSSTSDEDDEGVDMDYHPPSIPLYTLSYRRSSDRGPGCPTVCKTVRMRKKAKVTKRSSR